MQEDAFLTSKMFEKIDSKIIPNKDVFLMLRDMIIHRQDFKIKVDNNPFESEQKLLWDILLNTPDRNGVPYQEILSSRPDGGSFCITEDIKILETIKSKLIY